MESSSQFLLAIGGMLLIGVLTTALSRHSVLPRVTLLLVFGMIMGKEMVDVIPQVISDRFAIIAEMTLLMVGFLLGGKLTIESLKDSVGKVLWISITAAVVTAAVVTFGLMWVGVPKGISIILGCIASATAPAAVLDVVAELGKTNRFTNLLLSIVALDDVFGLALVASNEFPEYRQTLLTIVISSTVVFEIIGPVFTRLTVKRVQRT